MKKSNTVYDDGNFQDEINPDNIDYINTLELLADEKSKQKKIGAKPFKEYVGNNDKNKPKEASDFKKIPKFAKKEEVPDDFLLLDNTIDSSNLIGEDKIGLISLDSFSNTSKNAFPTDLQKVYLSNDKNSEVAIKVVKQDFNKHKDIKKNINEQVDDIGETNSKGGSDLEKALKKSKNDEVPNGFLSLDRTIESINLNNEDKIGLLRPNSLSNISKNAFPTDVQEDSLLNEKISEGNTNPEGCKEINIALPEFKLGTVPNDYLLQDRVTENLQINIDKESVTIGNKDDQEPNNTKIKNIDYIVYEKLIKRYPFKSFQDQMYIYNTETGCYKLLNDKQLKVIIRSGWDKNIEQQLTRFKVDDVIDRLRNSSDLISDQEFDNYSDYINFRNGVFSLIDNKLYPHSPEYNFTSYIDACYNFYEPKGETFINFINQCTEGEKIKIKTLQEIIGYVISNYTTAKKFFVFVGKPHTGKSTLLEVLKEIIGKQYTSAIPLHRLGERFMKARLLNMKLNISGELTDGVLKDIDTIKALTGMDEIEAEFKGKDPFSFKSTAKLAFAGNNMPLLKNIDNTSAFFDRIVFSLFNNTIPENERDHLLKDRLIAERNYIVTWAVEGLKRLIDNNFVFSESKESKDFKKQYIKEMNTVQDFIESHCMISKFNESFKTHKKELYNEYLKFCSENCYSPLNKYNLFNEIKKLDLKPGKFRKYGSVPLEGFYGIIISPKIY